MLRLARPGANRRDVECIMKRLPKLFDEFLYSGPNRRGELRYGWYFVMEYVRSLHSL